MSFLLGLTQPWAYVLIFLLAAGEGAAFIGLFLPGEAAMLLGGVLVYQGRASLPVMLVAACAGAVCGDSIGYEIGRHLGPRLQRGWLGRRIGQQRWQRANDYVRRRGGRAVFLGRFVGVLRALVPALAGQAQIPYPTFLLYNVAGGVLWAGAFILLGVAAGGSWHVVEQWAGRASLVLLIVLAAGVVVTLAGRWVAGHLGDLAAKRDELLERPLLARLRGRFRRQIDFARRRLDPGRRFGLYLTTGLVLAVAGAWIFGAILQDVLAREEIAYIDRPTVVLLAQHRERWLNHAMEVVTFFGSALFVSLAAATTATISFVRTRQTRWPALLAASLVGGIALDDVVKVLVDRPRPDLHPLVHAAGSSFPSGHTTAAAALFSALAFILTRRRPWKASVWIWTVCLFAAALVGLSRVYLGVHWPTDVLAGFALGGFWTAVAATATATWPRAQGGVGSEGWG